MLKRLPVVFLFLLILSLTLTGCLEPNLVLEVEPDPVEFSLENTSQEVTVKVTVGGFGQITVNTISLTIDTEEGENPFADFSEEIEVNETFQAVPGINREETQTIDIEQLWEDFDLHDEYDEIDEADFETFYEENLSGRTFILNVLLEGSVTSQASVDLIFE